MVHGGPKVFKISSAPAGSILGLRPKSRFLLLGGPVNVVAAGIAINLGERLPAPKFGKAAEAEELLGLLSKIETEFVQRLRPS
jgi:hypothetical protein